MNHREQSTMGARPRLTGLLLAAGLAAVVAVVVAAPAWASTGTAATPRGAAPDHYVAKTGSDTSGNGSAAKPWLTIQKAASSVTPGEVVTIGPGVYDERVTIPARAAGTSADATQFIAGGAVTVTGGLDIRSDFTKVVGLEITPGSDAVKDVSYRGQVFVQGSHVTLKDLDVHDIARASAICLLSTESHITISGCTIDRPKHACISSTNGGAGRHANRVTVRNCTMTRWGGEVAVYAYGDYWRIEGCEIRGIAAGWQGAPVWNGDGIWPNYSRHSVIRDCRIYDIWPYKGYASGQHADGIQFWIATRDLAITGCTLGSWKRGGPDNDPGATNAIMAGTVSAGSTCTATIRNCLFLSGIARNSHAMATCQERNARLTLRVIANTFFSNYPDLSGCDSVLLRRNVFYTSNGGSGSSIDSDWNAFLWNPNDRGPSRIYADDARPSSHSLGKTYAKRLFAADIFVNPDVGAATDYGLNADFAPRPGSRIEGLGGRGATRR
jgi:hypothetical protein